MHVSYQLRLPQPSAFSARLSECDVDLCETLVSVSKLTNTEAMALHLS